MHHILVGITGSVATVKIYNLISDLENIFNNDIQIQLICTSKSIHFFDKKLLTKYKLYEDVDEWKDYKKGDPVLHIELRKWADLFLVAPIDANTLGKMANGICDNLLTCVMRAWDPAKALVLAPAMNTCMWNHPITNQQLKIIKQWGFVSIIDPIIKLLACGDQGVGAMEETNVIANRVKEILMHNQYIKSS
jgi:phosphopantothenoylcysteine decarboxylase